MNFDRFRCRGCLSRVTEEHGKEEAWVRRPVRHLPPCTSTTAVRSCSVSVYTFGEGFEDPRRSRRKHTFAVVPRLPGGFLKNETQLQAHCASWPKAWRWTRRRVPHCAWTSPAPCASRSTATRCCYPARTASAGRVWRPTGDSPRSARCAGRR